LRSRLNLHPKTSGGLVGGWLAVILLYVLATYARFNPPPEVAAAIGGLVGFVVSYFIPDEVAVPALPVQPPPPVVAPPSPVPPPTP
jgi:hypothetical protein